MTLISDARKLRVSGAAIGIIAALCAGLAQADTPGTTAPAPSKHQLMKDCMAKQRAANSGLPKEDMKSACKDVTKTEKQNDDAAKKAEDAPKQPPAT